MRRWRKMTWVILAWTGLIVWWMISAIVAVSNEAGKCTNDPYLSQSDCENAVAAGGGLGIALIGFVGFVGFVALALVWFMTKPKVQQVLVITPEQAAASVTPPSAGP